MSEGRIRNFTEDTKAFLLEQVEEKDESWRVQFPQLSGALDADNIAVRTQEGLNLLSAVEAYYRELQKGGEEEKRTQEFLQNNTYEAVEKAVFERISAKDMNGDKKETIEDLQDNSTYKDTYEFLLRLKKCERNQGE